MPNALLDALSRYGEPAAGLLSGMVAEPIAGWAGLLGGGVNGIERTRNALTYQPRTAQGRAGMNSLASLLHDASHVMVDENPPVRMAVDGFNGLADQLGAISPALGAMFKASPYALGLLGSDAAAVGRGAMENIGKTGVRGPLALQDGMIGFKAGPEDALRYHSDQVRAAVQRQLDPQAIEALRKYGSPDDAPLSAVMQVLKQK